LNKSLNGTVEDFSQAVEKLLKICSITTKKVDKKKDRLLIIEHKAKLIAQLNDTFNPALVLHLTVLIVFTSITGAILHASGKFVSHILEYIKPNLTPDQNAILVKYHSKTLLNSLL